MPEETPVQPTERDDQAADVQAPPAATEADDLGDAGKKALQAERERAKAAERDVAALRAEIAKRDADAAEAERKAAEKNGEWEKVAQGHAEEIKRLKSDLAQRDAERDLQKAVKEAGLPDDLSEYVKGSSYDEMLESAKALAKRFARQEAPDTDAGKRGNRGGSTQKDESLLATYQFGKR